MSLVEILVALAVVITIFTPIFSLLSMATIKAYRGGDETVATIYANDVLEIIRGAPFDAFPPDDQWMDRKQILYEHNIPTGYELDKYEDRYNLKAKVSEVPGYPPNYIKMVTVQVVFQSRLKGESADKKPKEVTLVTFYTPSQ